MSKYRDTLAADFDRQKFNNDQKTCLLGRFDKLAAIRGDEFSFRVFFSSYGSTDNTEDKIKAIKSSEALAATNCINALSPAAKAIYGVLKEKKLARKDDDERTWKGLDSLDVDIHNDTRIRANLWQWEETFTDKGVLERKQVLRSSLASVQDTKSDFALVVRY